MQLVPLEPQVRLGLLVLQVTQALRDRLVQQAPLVQREQLGTRDLLDRKVPQDLLVLPEQRVLLALQVRQEPLVLPDQQGLQEQLDRQVQLVQMQRRFLVS